MTEKIYYRDAYKFEFRATVLNTLEEQGRYAVILDRTCFYPEGGGQPSDHGWINGIRVYDAQLKGNEVIHYLEKPLPGKQVQGKVDAERRLDLMQQHTGQHLLSQSLLQTGECQTVSVHFGETYTAIETDAPSLSADTLSRSQELANRIINRNLPVKIHWVNPEEVHRFNIRKPPPDVKKIRLVEVEDFECTACGGTHVSRTGEVGLIQIVDEEKLRGHVRLHAKIGRRAYNDYAQKNGLIKQLRKSLTCGEEEILPRVTELLSQEKNNRKEVSRLQAELMTLRAQLALQSAPEISGNRYVSQTFTDADHKIMKAFVEEVIATPERIAVAVSRNGDQVQWVIGHSCSVSVDLPGIVNPLLPIIEGGGGGSGHLMQGGGKSPDGIPDFVNRFKQRIEQELTQ